MAIQMSEPMRGLHAAVDDELRDAILRRGGSTELARVVLATNEFALVKGEENRALRAAIDHLKAENAAQRKELDRTWFVLKDFGAHPGRTNDLLSDCVRKALETKTPNV